MGPLTIRTNANALRHLFIILSSIIIASVACADPKDQESESYFAISVEDSAQAEMFADSGNRLLYVHWDLPAAKSILEAALKINPRLSRARADLAWYHVLSESNDDAFREMERAMEDDPRNPKWSTWLGWLHLRNGNLNQAENEVSKSLAIDPEYAEGLHVKSKIALARKEFEMAIALHEQAASLDPRWRTALAHTLAVSGNLKKATEFIETMENNPWNTYGMVKVYLALGKREKAFEWLQKAYEQRHPFFQWGRTDKDLMEIWDTPEFQNLYSNLD